MQNPRKILLAILLSLTAFTVFGAEWELIWAEEFNYTGLPDSDIWNYESGFRRGNYIQYYTTARKENVRVENGMLVIEGRKEKFENPKYKLGWKEPEFSEYTSGSINTEKKVSWLYGRIEVRASLPEGYGVWPAIWMMGNNRSETGWPLCGEIDIMEFYGRNPKWIHGTVHYGPKPNVQSAAGKTPIDYKLDKFHVFALEWFPDRMDFFFDGEMYFSFNIDEAGTGPENPFRKPQYLLLNLALGSKKNPQIDGSMFPQFFKVDYVRVYELKR